MTKRIMAVPALLLLAIAGCASKGDITESGITAIRSSCPTVAIPAATGDITTFNPAASRDASAIDVVASITNLRSTCDESGDHIVTNATFDVYGQRRDPHGERDVVLDYFVTVVQGGTNVVAKRVSRVNLHFADGAYRASGAGAGSSQVLRSAATLPENVRDEITRKRKSGEADAALDPMADPKVRSAVTRATFEMLVGFQLTQEQLQYNATR